VTIHHSPAHTAQEVAASVHVPGGTFAKTLVVKIDGALALAVIPATRTLDLELLRGAAVAQRVEIAQRDDFIDRFEGCQLGTAPPFGNLFGMRTWCDSALAKRRYITFNTGSAADFAIVRFMDYRRLARPRIAKLTEQPHEQSSPAFR
jgi:Ala-tRNA(Pro) deacylase